MYNVEDNCVPDKILLPQVILPNVSSLV